MSTGLTPINRALNLIPKRAESRHAEELRSTFVDSGVAVALEGVDHQILYGRRGTGKTHAFRYLETVVNMGGNIAVYADLRTLGSAEGVFGDEPVPKHERAARLMVDLLGHFHDTLVEAALNDDVLIRDRTFIEELDSLELAISRVRVVGEVETTGSTEEDRRDGRRVGISAEIATSPSLGFEAGGDFQIGHRRVDEVTRRGTQRIELNFSDVARSLRSIARSLTTRRVWILLDEWSSVSLEVQPYLAAFLVRCVLPLQQFTVKIAAIEQQTRFRDQDTNGNLIGLELGADISANVDLDEFMVFEQNETRAREFFRNLLFRHLVTRHDDGRSEVGVGIGTEQDFVRQGFSDSRALDELVRAAEGVPRDAINIAAKAGLRASDRRIAVGDVRAAARSWYQNDKEAALSGRREAVELLNWIIERVIRQKRARGFLVDQRSAESSLLRVLFDARVLHVVRRGYSGQDAPGVRYNVYLIDYGAYVDLMLTQNAPLGVLSGEDDGSYVDVPTQDLRAIRRAILDMSTFSASGV